MSAKAYLITFPPPTVVIAEDRSELFEWVRELVHDGFDFEVLSVKELAAQGDVYPAGSWDPDRELTCAEIAQEMSDRGQR